MPQNFFCHAHAVTQTFFRNSEIVFKNPFKRVNPSKTGCRNFYETNPIYIKSSKEIEAKSNGRIKRKRLNGKMQILEKPYLQKSKYP